MSGSFQSKTLVNAFHSSTTVKKVEIDLKADMVELN